MSELSTPVNDSISYWYHNKFFDSFHKVFHIPETRASGRPELSHDFCSGGDCFVNLGLAVG